MNVKTTLLQENEPGAICRAELPCPSWEDPARVCALNFSVTPAGVLSFDNRQPGAKACAGRRASRLMAEAMVRTARERCPEALPGRTTRGLARELRVHNWFYRLGILRRHSVTSEMGGLDPAAPDYDDNAVCFEHPIRSLPQVLKLMLKHTKLLLKKK